LGVNNGEFDTFVAGVQVAELHKGHWRGLFNHIAVDKLPLARLTDPMGSHPQGACIDMQVLFC
jgi:hypothetical protein